MLPAALLSRRQARWLLQEAELLPCPSARNAHGGSGQPLRLASPPAGTGAQEMWALPPLPSAPGQFSLENLLQMKKKNVPAGFFWGTKNYQSLEVFFPHACQQFSHMETPVTAFTLLFLTAGVPAM